MSGRLCQWNDARDSRASCEGRAAAAAGGDAGDNPFPVDQPSGNSPQINTGVVGDNTALTWIAKDNEAFTVDLVDPEGNDQALGVSVTLRAITVDLATGPAGAITSTAADVLAVIEADTGGADDIVAMSDTQSSTGLGVVAAETAASTAAAPLVTSPAGAAWDAGFDSWAADPAGGPGRDCCATAYGGGYTP